MRPILMLQALTRTERHEATSAVFDTVNALGGYIDDMQMYSNIMNTIRLTLPENRFAALIETLREHGIHVDPPTDLPDRTDNVDADTGADADAGPERMATLQLTFIHNEPDLRREIPPIPG